MRTVLKRGKKRVPKRLVAVGGWRVVAVGGWQLAVGGGWRLVAVGGWRLVVPGGGTQGRSLAKKKSSSQRSPRPLVPSALPACVTDVRTKPHHCHSPAADGPATMCHLRPCCRQLTSGRQQASFIRGVGVFWTRPTHPTLDPPTRLLTHPDPPPLL